MGSQRDRVARWKRWTGPVIFFALATCAPRMGVAAGDQPANWRNEYFIAAEPMGLEAQNSYPASLYRMGNDDQLHLVRQFFGPREHFSDFANDLHGTIYLAGRSGIYVVHTADPKDAAYVTVLHFDDTFCWGAVHGSVAGTSVQPGVQYCPGQNIDIVTANANPKLPRNGPGSWSAFKWLQFSGEGGGPYQVGPPTAEIDDANLVMPFGTKPKVTLARLPAPDQASPKLKRRVSILASTDRYLVIWIQPAAFSVSPGAGMKSPPHEAPVHVLLLNKQTHRWQTLELPTAVSTRTNVPVRIFGDWMVITEMSWSPPDGQPASAGLGIGSEQKTPIYSATSDIHAAYDRRFQNIEIPGKLAIWNLADGRKLMLNTGQEDSEVLKITKRGAMLYRVNDSLYSARIDTGKIGSAIRLAKAPAVADIHWAFRSGPDPGAAAGQ